MGSHPVSGMTLPTLLIALAIITATVHMSLPAYHSMLQKHRAERVLQNLARAINSGRSTAVREGSMVTVCPGLAGARCSGSWSDGLLVFTDANGDRRVNGRDRIILRQQWRNAGGTLRWRAFGNRQYLSINAMGQIRHQNGNFTWCPADGNPMGAGQLILNSTGRIRVALDRNGDGIAENSRGRPIAC